MFIGVSTRDCRVACEAALKDIEDKITSDRKEIGDKAYQSLHDGAVHNGLVPTLENLQTMRDMAARDVEHMMEDHPLLPVLERVRVYIKMLDWTTDPDIALDASSFALLGEHLPQHDTKVQAPTAVCYNT